MTARSWWFSISSFRMLWCALLEPNSTPSGTMQAQRPPVLSIRRKSARKSNSVFLVLVTAFRSSLMLSASTVPLNGGLYIILTHRGKVCVIPIFIRRTPVLDVFGSPAGGYSTLLRVSRLKCTHGLDTLRRALCQPIRRSKVKYVFDWLNL